MSIIEERLRIVPEFKEDDRRWILPILTGKLDRRLSRWDAEQVELELSVKDRTTGQQRVVLEAWIAGLPKFVATSTEADLTNAIADIRDDLFTQLDRHLSKQEAARNR